MKPKKWMLLVASILEKSQVTNLDAWMAKWCELQLPPVLPEGHHNRLQTNVMPGSASVAIDKFANKLWDDEMYYFNVMATPYLWGEKKTTHTGSVNRHLKNKRVTLKDVTGSRTVTHHSSSTMTTTTIKRLMWIQTLVWMFSFSRMLLVPHHHNTRFHSRTRSSFYHPPLFSNG